MKDFKFQFDSRPSSVSLFLAVEFLDSQNPTRGQLPSLIISISKRFNVRQWILKKFYNYKKKNSKQWIFFSKNAGYLTYIYNHRFELGLHAKTWIVDYRDFFIFRYNGEVFRKDGRGIYIDKSGRKFIKDFQSRIHSPEKIIYAGGKDTRYVLTYKFMKSVKIKFKDGNKDNLKVFNLEVINKAKEAKEIKEAKEAKKLESKRWKEI